MVAAGTRVVGSVLGLERPTFRDGRFHRCGHDMSSDARCATREDLPGFDGRFGHVDASFHAAVVSRSAAAHGNA